MDFHPTIRWVSNPRRPDQVEQTGVKEAHVFDDAPKGSQQVEQVLKAGGTASVRRCSFGKEFTSFLGR